ncbi:MAG: chemotaxis protein CheA, partial [Miltoncostaeaceae bacterium]
APPPAPAAAPTLEEPAAGASTGRAAPKMAASTVRVGTDKLDELMNLMGEMVIQRTRLAQAAGQDTHTEVGAAIDDFGRAANDLQSLVMQMRMTEVDVVFQRFPRMVRDLGNSLEKKIELIITGENTELDRTVIDELGDPLVHLLRNAADHGLESPADREAAGKDPVGTIRLEAHHTGNSVEITVSEDGRGIDPDSIRGAAVSKGLMDREQADALSDQEAVELIFRSGFSTAAATTDVSGRGVGMDAVRSKIRGLNGDVVIESTLGEGTTFKITLPLTLAIIQALLVRSGHHVYALPLDSIEETVVLRRDETRAVNGQDCLVLRDHIVPLVALRDRLRLGAGEDEEDQLNVVVVRSGDSRLGVVVDALVGQQDIVIKHLPGYLGDVEGVAGATILGDGSVALIVDVGALKGSGKGGSA